MSLIAFVITFHRAATIMAQLVGQSSVKTSLQQVTIPVLWPGHE